MLMMSNSNSWANLPPTLTMKELAGVLHLSVRTIQRLIENEKLNELPPGRKIGSKWVWVTKVVLDWISPPTPIQNVSATLGHQLMQANKGREK
jgi:excisionase family DNA binding protein